MQEYIISGLSLSCVFTLHEYIEKNYSWSYKILEIYGQENSNQAYMVTSSALTSAEETEFYNLVSAFSCEIPFTDPNKNQIVDPDSLTSFEPNPNVEIFSNQLLKYDFNYPWHFVSPKNKIARRDLFTSYGIYSYYSPYILPFSCRLRAITFNNYYIYAKFKFELFKMKRNKTYSLLYRWTINTNTRFAYNTLKELSDITVEQGEGLFARLILLPNSRVWNTNFSVYVEPIKMNLNENERWT